MRHSSRLVRRDRTRSTVLSKRSAKIRLRQCGLLQQNRRVTTRSRTLRPEHGRSEASRTYRLCTRREGDPHKGHDATCIRARAVTRRASSSWVTLSTIRPMGTRAEIRKLIGIGLIPFEETALCHQQTSSRLSQTPNLPPLALQELGAFGRIDPPILNQQFYPALCRFERCFPDSGPSKPFFFESICQGGNCDPRGLTSFFYFGGPQACACHLIYQIPNHYLRGIVARQTGLAQHLQRVTGFRKVRFPAHGLLGTNRQCLKIHSA